jgi:hypothetical protein
MLGEAPGPVLAVDQVAVDLHVEDATAAFDELGLNVELPFDRLRQTGGFGQVVSLSAVSDGDVHRTFSRMLGRPYYSRPAAGFHAGPRQAEPVALGVSLEGPGDCGAWQKGVTRGWLAWRSRGGGADITRNASGLNARRGDGKPPSGSDLLVLAGADRARPRTTRCCRR